MARRFDNVELLVERDGGLDKQIKVGDALGEIAHLQVGLMIGGETLPKAAISSPLNQSEQTNPSCQIQVERSVRQCPGPGEAGFA